MGDRGGTATTPTASSYSPNYTRWEIGGEPQPIDVGGVAIGIIPDGRSGGNRNLLLRYSLGLPLYPMGDRGGTATWALGTAYLPELYPMGDRGGTATWDDDQTRPIGLYPMGDRGGTAT